MDYSIGQYRIGNEIGRGSFANVYKGVHMRTQTAVAIKSVVRAKLNKKLLENLESEIKILKTLSHPHIVALIDCQHSSSYIHLVMEYCSLGDLSYFIKKRDKLVNIPLVVSMVEKFPNPPHGGLNEVVVRHFLKQLASALLFLRDLNLIHRDVKPQNLLLCPPPRTEQEAIELGYAGRWGLPVLKLADFGFARILPSTSMAETLCGSPLYMAPEILRYEKYDAKADLWSVGTVLYEMTMGKAPFRANNHVELLRKIEKSDDRIKFSEEVPISEEMKTLIRGLLRRNPVERMGFREFFDDEVVRGEIQEVEDIVSGLDAMEQDKFIAEYLPNNATPPASHSISSRPHSAAIPTATPSAPATVNTGVTVVRSAQPSPARLPSQTQVPTTARPQMSSFASHQRTVLPTHEQQKVPLEKSDKLEDSSSPVSSVMVQQGASSNDLHPLQPVLSRRSSGLSSGPVAINPARPEDDVMFEREYVVVEKRTVEVNALADELANSPKMINNAALQRRLSSTSRAPTNPRTRGYSHSYERRFSYATSPGSTLGKALSMASARLFGKTDSSPSSGSPPFSYGKSSRGSTPPNESHHIDERELNIISQVEDLARKSNVVYQFAQVKFSQLLPSTPSSEITLSSELTPDAVVSLSEEALVLFVKSLSLLAKSMDLAATWWAENGNIGASSRLNNAVQWVREQFNESLEKAEYVRLKLADPTGKGISHAFEATSDVTAEKLIYDRALEMSRAAAINELVGDDLHGCETAYETALWMLQSILDQDGTGEPVDESDKRTVEGFWEGELTFLDIGGIRTRLVALKKKIEMSTSSTHSHTPIAASAARTSALV
ncbi:kinase-like domain-containing protein [Lipomyces arxii]|uniref:kinase-like domain-containing protein n=1 Tax=Lipomyces arxii TaxID=56418 RepID=UPI0034CFB32F